MAKSIGCRKIRVVLTNKNVDKMQALKGCVSLSQGAEDPKHCLVQLWSSEFLRRHQGRRR